MGTNASPLDPKLNALADNGGFVETELPELGSPLIDAGENSLIPAGITTDERGHNPSPGKSTSAAAVETKYVVTQNVLSASHCASETGVLGTRSGWLDFGPLGSPVRRILSSCLKETFNDVNAEHGGATASVSRVFKSRQGKSKLQGSGMATRPFRPATSELPKSVATPVVRL